MDIAMQQMPKSMVIVLWILGIELYWFSFTILLALVFWFLCAIDTLLWYYMARSRKVVSSRTWQDWVVSKLVMFIILAWIILISWHLAYSTDIWWIDAWWSLLSILAAWALCMWQIVSILENLAMITHWLEQWIIKFAIRVLLKIFWIWAERIEQKLNRYSLSPTIEWTTEWKIY